jgi:hypothetical protein
VFEFLVGDFAVVAGATMVALGAWRIFPFAVNRMLRDTPAYRGLLNRGIFLTGALMVLWIAVFDNWRQVIGIPTGWLQDDKAQRASDPFYSGDIADPIRIVSWILFGATIIGAAYLFARFSRGYAEPLILGPVSLVAFFILNTIRLRYDVDSVRIAYGTIESPLDIFLTLLWTLVLWISMGLIVLTMFLLAWAPFAFIFSLIYRKMIAPTVYEEPAVFRRIRERRVERWHGSS